MTRWQKEWGKLKSKLDFVGIKGALHGVALQAFWDFRGCRMEHFVHICRTYTVQMTLSNNLGVCPFYMPTPTTPRYVRSLTQLA